MLVQVCVHEGALHQGLAVVEHAVHLDGRDVLAQRGELALLNRADLAFGIQHVDMHALHAQEAVGHGAAGVARGGHQHIHQALTLAAAEVAQHACHETGAHILECQGGSVEEFQTEDVLFDFNQRDGEAKGLVHDALQGGGFHVLAEEGGGHVQTYLLKTHVLHVVEEALVELNEPFGHVESAVLGQTFLHGFLQSGQGCPAVGAVVFHKICVISVKIR